MHTTGVLLSGWSFVTSLKNYRMKEPQLVIVKILKPEKIMGIQGAFVSISPFGDSSVPDELLYEGCGYPQADNFIYDAGDVTFYRTLY